MSEPPHLTIVDSPGDRARQRIANALHDHTFNVPWKKPFLQMLAFGCSATEAALYADVSRELAHRERHNDALFDRCWGEAKEIAADLLEDEAWRRAVDGRKRIVRKEKRDWRGKVIESTVEEVEETSDSLLQFLMKASRPEKFRERIDHRIGGTDGGPVQVEVDRRPTRERMLALLKLAQELELPPGVPPVIEATSSETGSTGPGGPA